MTTVRAALLALAVTVLALLMAVLAGGCGADRPAVNTAVAVGVGAFGAGLVTAGQVCTDREWDDCRPVLLTSALAVVGTALAAGATAYLYTAEDTWTGSGAALAPPPLEPAEEGGRGAVDFAGAPSFGPTLAHVDAGVAPPDRPPDKAASAEVHSSTP